MAGNLIFIDKNTSFSGNLKAEEVIVEGFVEGDIDASDKVLIKSGAVINGSIRTPELLFEEGGQHNGLIQLELENPGKKDKLENSLRPSRKAKESDQEKEKVQKPSEIKAIEKEGAKRLW